jgi:hypothetical protein
MMPARLLILVFALLCVSCGAKRPGITVQDYGLYDAVILTSGNWKLGIPVSIASVTGLEHRETVLRIPAEDGRYWGFRALLSNPTDRTVRVTYDIRHPEFTTPDGTAMTEVSEEFDLPAGASTTPEFLWMFIEGCEHEFVPGPWTFQIQFDGRPALTKTFEIYKPE